MRVACGTWNIQGTDPGYISRRKIKKWLDDSAMLQSARNPYKPMKACAVDMYVIGFQEVIPMDKNVRIPVPKIIINGANNMDITRISIRDKVLWAWANRLISAINRFKKDGPEYSLYGAYMLNGIAMFVIARNELLRGEHIRNGRADTIRASEEASDMEVMMLPDNQSPGAVGIRFDCGGSSMAFVCAFLRGGEGLNACSRRNLQYRKISSEMFRDQGLSLDSHEYVFWFGDLNYCICPPAVGAFTPRQAWDFVKRGQLATLLEADELMAQRRAGMAFQGFQEGFPAFKPTSGYKSGFKPGSVKPGSDPSRRERGQISRRGRKKNYCQYPNWSDRILWRRKSNGYESNEFHGVLVAYAMADISVSEHRPVVAIVDIEITPERQAIPQFLAPQQSLPMLEYRPEPIFGVNGRDMSPGPVRRLMYDREPRPLEPTPSFVFQDVPRPTGPAPRSDSMWVPIATPLQERPPSPAPRLMARQEPPQQQPVFMMPEQPPQQQPVFMMPEQPPQQQPVFMLPEQPQQQQPVYMMQEQPRYAPSRVVRKQNADRAFGVRESDRNYEWLEGTPYSKVPIRAVAMAEGRSLDSDDSSATSSS